MLGCSWDVRSLRRCTFLRMTLVMLLLLFSLLALASGANGAVGHSPHTFLISGGESFSIYAPPEVPHTASSLLQQSRSPIYSAEIHGVITSVTIAYLRRVLQFAEAADANVL